MAAKTDRRISAKLDNYPDEYLLCRFRRHRWDVQGFYRARRGQQRFVVSVVECDTCETSREDWISNDGTVEHHYYYQSEGYRFEYDDDDRKEKLRVRNPDVRREMLSRMKVYESEDAFRSARK